MIVSKTFISLTFENISLYEVQTPGSGIWKNPGSETLSLTVGKKNGCLQDPDPDLPALQRRRGPGQKQEPTGGVQNRKLLAE